MIRWFVLALTLAAALPARAEPLTLLLDWFVNPDHASLIVAQENGWFNEAGFQVELIAPADPNDPPKLVAAGKARLAVSYQPQLYLLREQGLKLVRVATLVATPLNSLVVLRSGPIKSLADLKGRKVGYSVGGFEDALLAAMLKPHGLGLKDITLVNVNFSLSPSLASGQVDAVIGAFRNFELNQMDLAGTPGRAFYVEEEGVPAYDELILVAKEGDRDPAGLARLTGAIERAARFLLNHPDEGWALFVKGRKELDDEMNRRAWRDTLPRLAQQPALYDQGRYRRFGQFLAGQGLIKQAPDPMTLVLALPELP